MKNSTTASAAFFLAALLILPMSAFAHAFLDHADPKVGSVVTQPPQKIKIWFTQEIEPAFSTIVVSDSKGNQLDNKDAHQDQDDKKLLIVSVPKLPDGQYTVTWKVVSVDTHHTHGSFKFTVKAQS